MLPVNSMQASAPRCGQNSQHRLDHCHTIRDILTWFGGDISLWYMGTIVLERVVSRSKEAQTSMFTHESKPTPSPEMTRPITMTQKPEVKVWMAPPTAKTTAPLKSVPLLPMISPTCPAAMDVTAT